MITPKVMLELMLLSQRKIEVAALNALKANQTILNTTTPPLIIMVEAKIKAIDDQLKDVSIS